MSASTPSPRTPSSVSASPLGGVPSPKSSLPPDSLEDGEPEVADLLRYHNLSQKDATGLLQVSVKTVKRGWQSAQLSPHNRLDGEVPGPL